MPSAEFTFDIWYHIAEILHQEMDEIIGDDAVTEPFEALAALTLTCKAMVPLSRTHLFATLRLDLNTKRSTGFNNLISENPTLVNYVRNLEYFISDRDDIHIHGLLDKLRNLSTGLQSIHIHGISAVSESDQWSNLPQPLQLLLVQLIQCPTVTKLQLSNLKGVPSTLLQHGGRLTHIVLFRVDFLSSETGIEPENHPERSLIPRPAQFHTMFTDAVHFLTEPRHSGSNRQDQPLLDLRYVRDLKCDVDDIKDVEAVWNILHIARSGVHSLQLNVWDNIDLTGLGTALSTSSISTLKKLTIKRFQVGNENLDPLCGLVEELYTISVANILEEINLLVSFDIFQLSSAIMGALDGFDAVLTKPGSFPKLCLVSVEIIWSCSSHAKWKVIQNGVRAEHFPRLGKSDVMEFKFSTCAQCRCRGTCACSHPRHII